jgi:ATP-binding cassette subfamily F protein 3
MNRLVSLSDSCVSVLTVLDFLDLPSVIWLQNYLQELENTTTVVVTHDREFADTIGEELLVLRHKKLEKFRGNLSTYEREKYKKFKWMTSMQGALDKQKAHMEKTIQGNIQAAKKTGDDKKLKQAASRRKKLDERMGMQVNDKGHRFKLNRDRGGYFNSARGDIDIPEFDPPVMIAFPSIPPDLRFPGSLVSLEKVSYAYSVKNSKGPVILNDIDLTIQPGDRIGICGLNGSGKTTLVSIIMGSDESGSLVLPTKGSITRHARCKVARFSQQVVEQLEAFGKESPGMTSLAHMMDISNGQLEEKHARGLLSHLGLQGQIASDIPIAALSGGQKVRLAFAKLVWQPPHLLILDEVREFFDCNR